MYEHDCDKCIPLGEHDGHDLYWCDQSGPLPTVIARWSDAPEDYVSGALLAGAYPVLAEAKERAEQRGLATAPR